ncbi:hypothetical protein [Pedobacter sp. R-06]|uniref:hypothetical protein n=1 Tax=Pedobacter sp. R-06 TaxID=3404051 RepID=UPI003CF26BB0
MKNLKKLFVIVLGVSAVQYAQAQSAKMSEPVGYRLGNGMNIIISENSRSPKAYSSFTLDAKAFEGKKDGIVELFNAVLNENTGKSPNISFKDNSGRLATSSTDFDKDLALMASLIRNAVLDQKDFNAAKAKLIASLKSQDYDYDQTVNEKSVNALSLEDIKNFYDRISPEKTFLTIAGDIDLSSARSSAKKAFGNWNKMQETALAFSK